jgi:hypothetical protein
VKKYLKAAFLYPWNLLFFAGAVGFAWMSPWPDALLPLVMAGEMTYLGALASMPRFRTAIDAREAQKLRDAKSMPSLSAQAQLQRMIDTLPAPALRRFLMLRQRCFEMRDIATGVMGSAEGGSSTADSIRTPALDRLLYLFLKLLVTQAGLERFLKSTSEAELTLRLKDVQERLAAAQQAQDERVTRSLQDSLADAQLRVDNYKKSKKDAEFVTVELDRIETKIHSLIEMGVSRQDPDTFSTQVTAAADSMQQTEDAVMRLQNLTGLADEVSEPPPIMSADLGPKVLGGR